ncbi:MAG: hypothetical protein QG597_276 [Actinomycetota bacterium]|nr:hypothetical protein [Actinomycetota bacterium]
MRPPREDDYLMPPEFDVTAAIVSRARAAPHVRQIKGSPQDG